MTSRRSTLLCSAIAISLLSSTACSQPASAQSPRDDRYALLVAVTFYENLPEKKHLKGPANDVLLVRKILVEKFRFSPERVVTLSEQEGKDKGKEFLPTKKNIQREFKRLAQVAKAGNQVMIHMGGHGSQQPEQPNSPDPEPDGLDETFLPRDIGQWDNEKSTVANAIIDDELGDWLKAIRDKKASVWITLDSCHSGTMIRGDGKEVTRDLDMIKDLGIPEKTIDKAVKEAAAREALKPEKARGGDPAAAFKLAKQGGIVAIYAAQPTEVTLEREMPPRTDDAPIYGLLSYTMCMVLSEAAEKSKEPITYSELARRIQGQYVAWGRTFPTPLIEGDDRDREILGDKIWPGRSSILLSSKREVITINAGSIHGLTEGSILSVAPPPGQGDKRLGYVRIASVRTLESTVEPCDETGKPAETKFANGAACAKHFIDMGSQKLKVAIDDNDPKGKPIAEELRKKLMAVIAKCEGPESLIQKVEKRDQADWLVRGWDAEGKKIVLIPAAGWSAGRDAATAPAFGPATVDDQLGDWLKEALGRIARAECLKRMAADTSAKSDGTGGVQVKIEPMRRKDQADTRGSIAMTWPSPSLPVFDGDLMAVRISNPGKIPVDVTIMYIDSGCGISCLYPLDGEINRLGPGDSVTTKFRVSGKTAGMEQLVVLAVKGQGQNVDFSTLAQPSLESAFKDAGTRDVALKQSLESPLGKLLKKGLYGQGTSRGLSADEVDNHLMMLIPMHVHPQKRPLEPRSK